MSFDSKGSMPTTVYITRDPDRRGNYVCDGIADNVEWQAAVNHVFGMGGGKIFVGQGVYDFGSTGVTIPTTDWTRIVIEGVGGFSSAAGIGIGNVDGIVQINYSGADWALKYVCPNAATGAQGTTVKLKNLIFYLTGGSYLGGVYLYRPSQSHLSQIEVYALSKLAGSIGIHVEDDTGDFHTMDNCMSYSMDIGYELNTPTHLIESCTAYTCNSGFTSNAWEAQVGLDHQYNNCLASDMVNYGWDIYLATSVLLNCAVVGQSAGGGAAFRWRGGAHESLAKVRTGGTINGAVTNFTSSEVRVHVDNEIPERTRFLPVVDASGWTNIGAGLGQRVAEIDAEFEVAVMFGYVPWDFHVLQELELIIIPLITDANMKLTVNVGYAANGEAHNTHTSANTYNINAVTNVVQEIDISGQVGNLAVGDYISIHTTYSASATATDTAVVGARFNYT